MLRMSLVGRTGGFVNLKEVKDSEGEVKSYQSTFTVFCRDRGVEFPVLCTWNLRSTDAVKYLMIPKAKSDDEDNKKKPMYHSRLVAINGRLSVREQMATCKLVESVKYDDNGKIEKIVYQTDDEGNPYEDDVIQTSVCVYVDSLELLDANPDKSASNSKVKDDSQKNKKDRKGRKFQKSARDIEELNDEEEEEVAKAKRGRRVSAKDLEEEMEYEEN